MGRSSPAWQPAGIIPALRWLDLKLPIPFSGAHHKGAQRVRWRSRRDGRLSPPQLLAASFAGLVLAGTCGLRWLPGLYTGERLNWVDSLFTATSAACITGLAVVPTDSHFTPFGQAFILLLIQLGGLGMLGLASFVIVTLNRRLSLRQDALAGAGEMGGAARHVPVRHLLRDVLIFTLACEGLGFLLLWGSWTLWPPRPDIGVGATAWHALFHSVNAFCNAGFTTFNDSLLSFDNRPGTQLIIMGGIFLGGLGFLTLEELKLWLQARRCGRAFRMSLHTRLVLVTTFALLLIGWAVVALLEWTNDETLGPMRLHDKLFNALFSAVTPRSGGYNTIDFGQTLPATQFFTILLMAIGGAPGSTAGGIKVTTVGILAAMAWARLRARTSTDLWDRTLPETTANRAVGLFTFAFIVLTFGIGALTITELGTSFTPRPDFGLVVAEPFDFLDYMFEATSAFATVGLSTGVTPVLTTEGRLLMVLLMFVGRIGPLTFAAALSRDDPNQRLIQRFANEDVVVG